MEDKSILNIDTRNKRLLIRADLNVPINNNKISDETRIERFCSGISKLLKKNAKIIIITHLDVHHESLNTYNLQNWI